MRISSRLRTVLVCAMLEYAAMMGAPMRPEEIEELMRQLNQPKLAHVLRDESDPGDGDPETTNHQPQTRMSLCPN